LMIANSIGRKGMACGLLAIRYFAGYTK